MRNTGKPSEEIFDDHFKRFGKRAVVFKLFDSAHLRGLNGKHVEVPPQPSDRLVTHDGTTFYAEVKSTENPRRFPFSMLRPTQWGAARMVTAALGKYFVFVHSLTLNRWFRVPAEAIASWKDAGLKSVTWDELEIYRYPLD